MKVLYYNLQLGAFDGSNMHAQGLLEALKKNIGDQNVFVPEIKSKKNQKSEYSYKSDKIKLHLKGLLIPIRIIRRKRLSKLHANNIIKILKQNNFHPDIILARSVLYDETPIILKKRLKCQLVVEHNTPLVYEVCDIKKLDTKQNVRKFEKKILNNADGIYCVSSILKRMLVDSYGEAISNKSIVIPNGYISRLYCNMNKFEMRRKYNIINKRVIVFVGSLQKWHGIDNLIKAATCLEKRKDLEFWVFGDGVERDLIKKYVKTHSNLRWFGNVPLEKMAQLLTICDLGIMPYKEINNFYFSPLKMFDMIGARLPFIGMKIGQIEEIANEDLNESFLIDNTEGELLAQHIMDVIDDDKKYSLMKAILKSNSEKHTWDCRAQILVNWMEEILTKS